MKAKKKIRKARKITKLKQSGLINKVIFLSVVFLGVLFLFGLSHQGKYLGLKNKQKSLTAVLVSPTFIPSPTATPTPTPIPKPSGFCLYIPVLMYHHVEDMDKAKAEGHQFETVSPDIFDSQMQYLVAHGYRTIKAEELISAIINHQSLGKVAVVTLDDGYDDVYINAFQSAKKYGVVLNLMIPTGLLNNPGFMTWDQLKEIAGAGNGVYNHTWSHFSLNSGSDDKVITEIMTAKQQLDSNLGGNDNIFTYPYGSYSDRVVGILKSHGFIGAFSTVPGNSECEGNIMYLYRTRVGNAPLSSYGVY